MIRSTIRNGVVEPPEENNSGDELYLSISELRNTCNTSHLKIFCAQEVTPAGCTTPGVVAFVCGETNMNSLTKQISTVCHNSWWSVSLDSSVVTA